MRRLAALVALCMLARCSSKPKDNSRVDECLPRPQATYYDDSLGVRDFSSLMERENLSLGDFLVLIEHIESLSELEEYALRTKVSYPDRESMEFEADYNTLYGAPINTHNFRHGICDELSVYILPGLLNVKKHNPQEVKEIYLVECQGDYKKSEGEIKHSAHAYVVFKTIGGWKYFNNLKLSEEILNTFEEAVEHAALATNFVKPNIAYKGRLIRESGDWIYDDNKSEELRPSEEIRMFCQ